MFKIFYLNIRPAFVSILFPVLGFFHGKFHKSLKMHLGVQVSESLGILSVQMFTTDGSNHLINFPMCTECKKGQKPIKRLKILHAMLLCNLSHEA